MNKITIVVEGGAVQTVFTDEDIEIEIVDFDGCQGMPREIEYADYVDKLRETKKEILV